MKSLQDQLLNAGLVDKQSVKQVNKEKRKQAKVQRRSKEECVDETKLQAQLNRQQKAERDRELNKERDGKAEKKAIAAQIKQLIHTNSIDHKGDIEYNFTDGSKVKKILVNSNMQRQLISGRLTIVKLGENYHIVVNQVADKIAQRNTDYIIVANTQTDDTLEEDDPYADYQIPDDLMW